MKVTKRWHSRRGMHTAEYAICFGLVVAACVGMQTYVKRAVQARIKAGAEMMNKVTGGKSITVGTKTLTITDLPQYEPYYQDSSATASRASLVQETHEKGTTAAPTRKEKSRQTRQARSHQTERGADALGSDSDWTPAPPPEEGEGLQDKPK